MLGYDTDELEATIDTFRGFIHPDDLERVLAAESDYLDGRADRYQIEFRMLHRDGLYIDALSRAFLVRDDDGKPVRVVGTHVDISERNYAAQLLKEAKERAEEAALQLEEAKERAEEADRLKSAFLATMSHELRTPLNSIIGFTGILLQKLAGPLTEEQAKQLGMVQTSARHLLDLINDVLDISKIEAGQLQVLSEPFDLPELIREVTEAARPIAEAKGLDLRVDVSPPVGEIRSDRRRVGQIVTNLLSNAIKFTAVGHVQVSCIGDGSDVTINVEDTGIGISGEDLAKLFVPFQQVDTGLTRKYEGTGLGLSICKRLSEKLGGTIKVESEPGRGSIFTVRMPKGT
jgi:PAS domain S-box-containing protein